MNNIFALTILSFAFIAVGYPYARMARIGSKTENVALSFVLGSGLLTFGWFLIYLAIHSFTLTSFFVAATVLITLGCILTFRVKPAQPHLSMRLTLIDKWMLIGIAILSFLAVVVAWYNPIISWDTLTLYDYRALVIEGTGVLSSFEHSTYYLSYPLMTSLIHAAFYLLGGSSPQIFYSFVYIAILSIVYGRAKSWTSTRLALLATLLVGSNPLMWEHATISYTNLPYASLFVAGLFYLPTSLILSGMLIGLSTWVRSSEPFYLVGVFLILLQGYRHKQYIKAVLSALMIIAIRFTWSVYLSGAYARGGIVGAEPADIYNLGIFSKIYLNLSPITHYLWQFILTPYLGIWLILLFALASLAYARSILSLAAFLISGMVVAGVAIFSISYESWYSIGGSATRMILFMIPLITVLGVKVYYLLTEHYGHKK
jgi:hypothetical protein